MAQSIKKNFVYNILLNISSVVFPLITAPYVSRVLEPEGVGLFNFSNTYAGYFSLVALLGIPTYGVREVSKIRENKESLTKLVSQLLSIATLTTICVSIIYLLTIVFVGKLTENFIIFTLAGFAIYLAPFSINWYYQGLEEFGYITIRSLIIKTLSVILLFVFVRDKDDLKIYVIINVLGIVISNLWNYIKMRKAGVNPHFTLFGLKSHLKPLFVLLASSVAVSIYTILDTLMLGFIKGYEEVGYYSNALSISRVLLSAITSLSIVAVPRVSYYLKDSDYGKINGLLNKSFSIVSFLAFPAALGLICISSVFVPLFFGENFMGSIVPLKILSLLLIAIGLNNLTGVQILIGMGYDKLFLYSVLTGTFTNFVMNCFLIPFWGGIGASIASVTAETLILVVTTYYVYKKTPIRFKEWNNILKSLIGTIVLVPVFWGVKNVVSGWMLIILFIVVGGMFYMLIELLLKNSSLQLVAPVIKKVIKK